MSLNIEQNRSDRKWSRKELVGRVLWAACGPLLRYSPRLFWGWRRWLLSLFGAKVGRQVQIHPSVRVFIPWNLEIGDWTSIGFDTLLYNLGPMTIGEKVTISQGAHLCGGSHDYRDPSMPLQKLPLVIQDGAWICADAFIGPGVTVGKEAIIGARAVVMKDVKAGLVVAGNPVTTLATRS